jgi:hypothetical protein
VVINHVGWSEGDRPRGASSLVGNIDTVLRMELVGGKESRAGVLSAGQRDRFSEGCEPFAYRIESQALTGAREGRTAPVIVPAQTPQSGRLSLTDAERRVALVLLDEEGNARADGVLWHEALATLESQPEGMSKDTYSYLLKKLGQKQALVHTKAGKESRYFLTPLGLASLV